ncbi:MAG TPA: threonine synthase [Cyclobacteriaceae bacterium]|jgi:threonine synthase|nr:threonine synthase [Cyclobacteriaceae bacterium]
MKFYSTNNSKHLVSLQEAVIKGLAPDNGLYMPEKIPTFSQEFFNSLHEKSFREIALAVANELVGEDISTDQLKTIIDHTISFDAPLVEVEKNIFALELFHGPTLAFKDFGARFMSQMLGHFAKQQNREIVILVATSGDTGSAVANGFLGVDGTRVIVLYPQGKVSEIQEKQFTTLGKNITAIEVNGTFDDCQSLVKQAFLDQELNKSFFLTSANSINIARLIPQSFYYFYAWSRLPKNKNVVFSIPSGNFGNLTAGLIAKRMGLPIQHFVAATNINDIVPHYLTTKDFLPRSSASTISNAMDVGNPSNFARMLNLFHNNHSEMREQITGYSFTDEETREAMKEVFKKSKYTLDPHGAIGYLGLKKYQSQNLENVGVVLETAHPAKFLDVVESTLQTKLEIPDGLKFFLSKKKTSISCNADFNSFKNLLQQI